MTEVVNTITNSNMSEVMTWLSEILKKEDVNPRQLYYSELLVEELYNQLKNKNKNKDDFSAQITIKKQFTGLKIEIKARGESAFSLAALEELTIEDDDYMSYVILGSFKKKLQFYRRKGENIVLLKLNQLEKKRTIITLIALFLGIAIGAVIDSFFEGDARFIWIDDNILSSIQTMFLNALVLVAVPQIFFSILSGISNASSMATFSSIGKRLILFSLLKMGVYVALGMLAGHLIGGVIQTPEIDLEEELGVTSANVLRDLVVDIIPNDIVIPFYNSNILQLLFLAVLAGIIISRGKVWTLWAKNGIDFFNHLLSEMMDIILPFTPLAVMVSMIRLIMDTGLAAIISYAKIILASAIGLPFSILIAGLMVRILCKLSPTVYIKKIAKFIPLPFSLADSTACMSETLAFCHKDLGMEKRFVNFSIPLGMQVNMTGNGFYVGIVSMVLAHTFGIHVDMDFCFRFFWVQFVIAITGMGLVAMPSIYSSFGIPNVGVAMMIGIEPILDMFGTAQSVAANILSSFIVCQRTGEVDEEVYNRES